MLAISHAVGFAGIATLFPTIPFILFSPCFVGYYLTISLYHTVKQKASYLRYFFILFFHRAVENFSSVAVENFLAPGTLTRAKAVNPCPRLLGVMNAFGLLVAPGLDT